MVDRKQQQQPKEDKNNPLKALAGGSRDLRKYTHQIWLAGLGAFARAEAEGGKFFDALVDIGKDLEAKTRDKSESRVDELREKVLTRTGETMGKMERAFDDRLNKALSKLGIPNKREVELLRNRVQELTQALEAAQAGEPATQAPAQKPNRKKKA